MINIDELRRVIEELIDPTLKLTFKEAGSLLDLSIDEHQVVYAKIALKNRKKDESDIKLQLARIIKIQYGFPGVKLEFEDSKFTQEPKTSIKYIGIISGKGGVGKSSVTANLAVSLARLGKKVGIIDTDVYGSSIPSIFKLPIEPLSTTEDDEIIPASYENIQVISPEFFMPKNQPLMWRGPMLGKLLTLFFNNVVWDDVEYILLDLPPGTGDVALDVQGFIPSAKMIVVTTPHPNASHVALKAGLGAKEIGHEVIGVIENMSYYFHEQTHEKIEIFGKGGGQKVAEALDVPLLLQVPITLPNQDSYIYDIMDMNGKLYLALAQKLISLV
ncbi:MAG TPA: P-loop NTPase [Acholeplasma sp.]|jgi:ATP-binding protein involved in chromosome partitioning